MQSCAQVRTSTDPAYVADAMTFASWTQGAVLVVGVDPSGKGYMPLPDCRVPGVSYSQVNSPQVECMDHFASKGEMGAALPNLTMSLGASASFSDSYKVVMTTKSRFEATAPFIMMGQLAGNCAQAVAFASSITVGDHSIVQESSKQASANAGMARASGEGSQKIMDARQNIPITIRFTPLTVSSNVMCPAGQRPDPKNPGICVDDPHSVEYVMDITLDGSRASCDPVGACDFKLRVSLPRGPLQPYVLGEDTNVTTYTIPTSFTYADVASPGFNLNLYDVDVAGDEILATCPFAFSDAELARAVGGTPISQTCSGARASVTVSLKAKPR